MVRARAVPVPVGVLVLVALTAAAVAQPSAAFLNNVDVKAMLMLPRIQHDIHFERQSVEDAVVIAGKALEEASRNVDPTVAATARNLNDISLRVAAKLGGDLADLPEQFVERAEKLQHSVEKIYDVADSRDGSLLIAEEVGKIVAGILSDAQQMEDLGVSEFVAMWATSSRGCEALADGMGADGFTLKEKAQAALESVDAARRGFTTTTRLVGAYMLEVALILLVSCGLYWEVAAKVNNRDAKGAVYIVVLLIGSWVVLRLGSLAYPAVAGVASFAILPMMFVLTAVYSVVIHMRARWARHATAVVIVVAAVLLSRVLNSAEGRTGLRNAGFNLTCAAADAAQLQPVKLADVRMVDGRPQLVIQPEGMRQLRLAQGELIVHAVVGKQRTYKSTSASVFARNEAIGLPCGDTLFFGVASGTTPMTHGLWALAVPTPDGNTRVFLDMEGLGDPERTPAEAAALFSFTLLLSGTFSYHFKEFDSDFYSTIGQLSSVVSMLGQELIDADDEYYPHRLNFVLFNKGESQQSAVQQPPHANRALLERLFLNRALADSSALQGRQALLNVFNATQMRLYVPHTASDSDIRFFDDMVNWRGLPEASAFVDSMLAIKEDMGSGRKTVNGNVMTGFSVEWLVNRTASAINSADIKSIYDGVDFSELHEMICTRVQRVVKVDVARAVSRLHKTMPLPLKEFDDEAAAIRSRGLATANDNLNRANVPLKSVQEPCVAELGPWIDEKLEEPTERNTLLNTFSWRVGNWSECQGQCGAGTRTRPVDCVRGDDTSVGDSRCQGDMPVRSEECAFHEARWHVGEWSSCERAADEGFQSRSVECRDCGEAVDDALCGHAPNATRKCAEYGTEALSASVSVLATVAEAESSGTRGEESEDDVSLHGWWVVRYACKTYRAENVSSVAIPPSCEVVAVNTTSVDNATCTYSNTADAVELKAATESRKCWHESGFCPDYCRGVAAARSFNSSGTCTASITIECEVALQDDTSSADEAAGTS